ncbi:MAG: hypothetical protein RLZZ453_1270 [Chlamydiota bacterium]|jgi:chromosome segregation ATPase
MSSLFKIQIPSIQLTHGDHSLPLDALHCRDKVQQTAARALHDLITTNEKIQESLQTAKGQGHAHAIIHLVNNEVTISFGHTDLQHSTTNASDIVQRVHALYNDCISHRCECPPAQNQGTSSPSALLRIEETLQTLLTAIQQNDPSRLAAIESTLGVLSANIEALRLSQTEYAQASVDILEEAVETTRSLLTARERIQQLEAEKEQLAGRLDDLLQKSSAQDQLSHSQQSTIASLEDKLNLLTPALQQASESIKKQSSIILEAKTALDSLNQTIDKKNQENTHLAQTLTEKETELLAERQEGMRLSSELQRQESAIQTLKNNIVSLTSSLEEQKTTSHTLASQLKEATSSIGTIQTHAQDLAAALTAKEEELVDQLKDRETKIANFALFLEKATTQIELLGLEKEETKLNLLRASERADTLKQESEEQKKRIDSLQSDVTTLRSSLEQSTSNEEAREWFSSLTDQVSSMQEDYIRLCDTLEQKKAELSQANELNNRLSFELSNKHNNIATLAREISSLQSELDQVTETAQAEAKKTKAILTSMQRKIKQAEEDNESGLIDLKKKIAKEMQEYKELINSLEGKLEIANSDCEELYEFLKAAEAGHDLTRLELTEMQARLKLYDSQEETLTAAQFSEKELILKELADKQAAIAQLQNRMNQLIETTETEQKALNNEITSLTLALEHAAAQTTATNTTLQEEKSRLSEALETQKTELEKSLETQSHLHNHLKELQEILSALEEKNVSLCNDYETLVSSSKVEKEALLLQLDEMTERANMMMNESLLPFEQLVSDLQNRETYKGIEHDFRIKLLTSQLAQLQEELADLKTTNNTLLETKESLTQQLQKKLDTINTLKTDLGRLNTQINKEKHSSTEIARTNASLTETLQKEIKTISQLNLANAHLRSQLHATAEELKSVTEQLDQITATNSNLNWQLNQELSVVSENHRNTTSKLTLEKFRNVVHRVQAEIKRKALTAKRNELIKNQTAIKHLLLKTETLSERLAMYTLQEHDVVLPATSNQSSQYPELALPITPTPQEESSDTVPPASSSEESNIDRITRSTDPLNDAIDEALGRLSASPVLRQPIPPSQRPNPTQMQEVLQNLKSLKNVLDYCIENIDRPLMPRLSSSWENQAINEINAAVKTQGLSRLNPIRTADALLAETGHFSDKQIGRANLELQIREKLSMLEHPHFINRFIKESSIIAFTKKTLECYHRLLSLVGPQEKLISQALSKLQDDPTQQGSDPRSQESLQKQVKGYYDELGAVQNEHQQLLLKKHKTIEDNSRLRDLITKLRNPKTPADISLSERALLKFETKKKTEKEKEQLQMLVERYATRSRKLQLLIDSLIKSLEQETRPSNS